MWKKYKDVLLKLKWYKIAVVFWLDCFPLKERIHPFGTDQIGMLPKELEGRILFFNSTCIYDRETDSKKEKNIKTWRIKFTKYKNNTIFLVLIMVNQVSPNVTAPNGWPNGWVVSLITLEIRHFGSGDTRWILPI